MNLFNKRENHKKILNQNNSLHGHMQRIFSEHSIADGQVILDLGCAEIRTYSDFLIMKAGTYYGVDISQNSIATAKEKLKARSNCNLIRSSIEDLNLPDKTFDIIVCNNMLAYTDQKIALNKIISLLKPNGICISFFNNTWQYSVFKIFYPFKPLLKEILHSIIVLINSTLFYLCGIKIFHTIFNKKKVFKKLILKNNPLFFNIINDCDSLPYSVINFVFIK